MDKSRQRGQDKPYRQGDPRSEGKILSRDKNQHDRSVHSSKLGTTGRPPVRDSHRSSKGTKIQSPAKELQKPPQTYRKQIDARAVKPPSNQALQRKIRSDSELNPGFQKLLPIEIINIFKRLDTDGSGDISYEEFMNGLRDTHLSGLLIRQLKKSTESPSQACDRLFKEVDNNCSGDIDILELLRYYGHRHVDGFKPACFLFGDACLCRAFFALKPYILWLSITHFPFLLLSTFTPPQTPCTPRYADPYSCSGCRRDRRFPTFS